MTITKKIWALFLPIILFLPSLSFGAQAGAGKIQNPLSGTTDLMAFLNAIIDKGLLPLGTIIAIVAMIYAGFVFVTAGGDEGKIKTAKLVFLYTVIGIAILLGAKILAKVIETTIKSIQ